MTLLHLIVYLLCFGSACAEVSSGDLQNLSPDASENHDEDNADIFLDFENVQLKTFIDFISQMKSINYIPNNEAGSLETSLTVREAMTKRGAYDVFLTVLDTAGFAHVKVGDVYKIVRKDAKYSEPLPVYVGKSSRSLPESDETVRFVTFFRNVALNDVEPLLKSMLTPGAQTISLPSFNGVVITDRCFNIKSAMKIINELDNSGHQEMVSLVPLKNASALDVKEFLDQLIKKPDGAALARILGAGGDSSVEYFSSSVKIIAEERTNTLIMLGSKNSLSRIEHFIKNFIDKSLRRPDTPLHVYECQYVDAEQIKSILDEVTSNSGSNVKFGGVRGGVKYFNTVKIEADRVGNRLIVSCQDKYDWKLIQKTIEDLDKPQPQLAIETLIVEISQAHIKQLGGQTRNKTEGNPLPGINFQNSGLSNIQTNVLSGGGVRDILGDLSGAVSSLLKGSTVVSLGPAGGVWSIFRALKDVTNVSIISKPFITVANRVEGSVSSGEVRRIVAERAVSESGTTSNTSPSYTSARAETTIKYTPQINPEGLVNLKVDVEIVDFQANAEDTFNKNLTTNVTVADGQVLVLGGFVKTKVTENGSRTALLGSIPVLGWLFKNKNRNTDKSYIFIFVSTSVIKPRSLPGMGLYTKMKLHDAYDFVEDAVITKKSMDPVHNWFFNPEGENYSHKVTDFANARYQPTTVDLANDPYYRTSMFGDDEFERSFSQEVYDVHSKGPEIISLSGQEHQVRSGMELVDATERAELDKKRLMLKNLVMGIEDVEMDPKNDFKNLLVSDTELDDKKHDFHASLISDPVFASSDVDPKDSFHKFVTDGPTYSKSDAELSKLEKFSSLFDDSQHKPSDPMGSHNSKEVFAKGMTKDESQELKLDIKSKKSALNKLMADNQAAVDLPSDVSKNKMLTGLGNTVGTV